MAFPVGPTNGQTHQEGGKNYVYDAAGSAWLVDDLNTGATNLAIGTVDGTTVQVTSDTGGDATIPAATGTDAGVLSAADKTKLDTVETNAAADQLAAEVPVAAITNLTATDVQAALAEHQADIDAIGNLGGVFTGTGATVAALPTTREDGSAVQNGDTSILTADDGANESGWWVYDGTNWVFAKEIPETLALADATGVDTLAGVTGTALTAARSDHQHAQSRGAALPATDGTGGIRHVLQGHATLPDGDYVLINTNWVQI